MKRRTKRLGRILFNTLTAISLLLAIATAVLWVRSAFMSGSWMITQERFGEAGCSRTIKIGYSPGTIFVAVTNFTGTPHTQNILAGLVFTDMPLAGRDRTIRFLPVSWLPRTHADGLVPLFFGTDKTRTTWVARAYYLPLWIPLMTSIGLPAMWSYAAVSKRKRSLANHCPACGYDTRANPAKCSECGHEITAANL